MSAPLRERGLAEPSSPPELKLVPHQRRLPGAKTALAVVYVVAALYHWLNARGHVTPVVFGDEILYSKLAQSLVAGEGFAVRGETVVFPAPLAVLTQAPAWLLGSTAASFAAIKALNAAVMSLAVFPVYAIARRVTGVRLAVLAAAASVAGPALLYHAYLMSEAVAYPVFFLACATMLRAIERPSPRMELAVAAVSALACLTRIQFVVLPLAYLVAAPVAARSLRRHRLSSGLLAGLLAVPFAAAVALGTYRGALTLDFAVADILRWSGESAAILAFGAGWLVVPAALFGLVLAARARTAFGVLAALLVPAVLLEAALVSAGDANRVVERYVIYLVPLLVVACFAYVELGAPHRRLYAGTALALGAAALLYPFPARAGDVFTFDSPTYSAYAQLAAWWGHANAATIFAAVPLVGSVALAAISLRRRHAPVALTATAVGLLLLGGVPAYAGDRAVARGTLEHRAASAPDWLDRSGLGRADYLQLPGGSAHFGWVLEVWNRDFGRPVHLGRGGDWFATSHARIAPDGRLLVDGRPATGVLVVNDSGTAIELDGAVVARPRDGLTAYRLAPGPRVRLLAEGLLSDGWAAGVVSVRAWPAGRGVFRVTLALPPGRTPRTVTLRSDAATRRVALAPGDAKTVEVPGVARLRIETSHTDLLAAGTADARLVGVRIPALSHSQKP